MMSDVSATMKGNRVMLSGSMEGSGVMGRNSSTTFEWHNNTDVRLLSCCPTGLENTVMNYSAVCCSVLHFSVVPYIAMSCGLVLCNAGKFIVVKFSAMKCTEGKCNAV